MAQCIYNKRGCGGGFPVQICSMKIYPEGGKEDNYTSNEELVKSMLKRAIYWNYVLFKYVFVKVRLSIHT